MALIRSRGHGETDEEHIQRLSALRRAAIGASTLTAAVVPLSPFLISNPASASGKTHYALSTTTTSTTTTLPLAPVGLSTTTTTTTIPKITPSEEQIQISKALHDLQNLPQEGELQNAEQTLSTVQSEIPRTGNNLMNTVRHVGEMVSGVFVVAVAGGVLVVKRMLKKNKDEILNAISGN